MNKQTKDALGMAICLSSLFWIAALLCLAIYLGVYPGGNSEKFLLWGGKVGMTEREFGDALFLNFFGMIFLTTPFLYLFFKRKAVK